MIQGPICAKVYPEGIQPIQGNNCGLIPLCLATTLTLIKTHYYGGWFVPFRLFAAKRHYAQRRQKAMRKDEKTKKRHTKRQNKAMRNDEKTRPAEQKELSARKDEITPCEKTPFETLMVSPEGKTK